MSCLVVALTAYVVGAASWALSGVFVRFMRGGRDAFFPAPQGIDDGTVGVIACLEEIAEASWPGADAVARIQRFAAHELAAYLATKGGAA